MRSTVLAIILASALVPQGCGTQVGNGVHGDITTTSTPTDEDKAFTTAGSTDISLTSDGLKLFGSSQLGQVERHIFMQNGSPLMEMQAGVYLAYVTSGPAFRIAAPTDLTRQVSFSGTEVVLDVTATALANRVTIDLGSSDTALAEALSSSTVGLITTKTAKYVDGFQTAWDIDSTGKVTEIRVTDPNGGAITKFHAYGSVPAATPGQTTPSSSAVLSTTIDWQEVTGTAVKSFEDRMTALVWSADNGNTFATIETATAACAALPKVGTASWRLPSFDELNLAYDHEIGGRLANAQALDISAKYQGYWTSTLVSGTSYKTINLVEPSRQISFGQTGASAGFSVICVR